MYEVLSREFRGYGSLEFGTPFPPHSIEEVMNDSGPLELSVDWKRCWWWTANLSGPSESSYLQTAAEDQHIFMWSRWFFNGELPNLEPLLHVLVGNCWSALIPCSKACRFMRRSLDSKKFHCVETLIHSQFLIWTHSRSKIFWIDELNVEVGRMENDCTIKRSAIEWDKISIDEMRSGLGSSKYLIDTKR